MLQGTQAIILDADWLALDLTRAVAALVDQHSQYFAGANLRQVTHLGRRYVLLWARRARLDGAGKDQPQRQQKNEPASLHAKTCPWSVSGIHGLHRQVINDGK